MRVMSVCPPASTSTACGPLMTASTATPLSATVGGSAATSNSIVSTVSAPASSTARTAMVLRPGGNSAASSTKSSRSPMTTAPTSGSRLKLAIGDWPSAMTLPLIVSLTTVSPVSPSISSRGGIRSTSKVFSTVVVCPPALVALMPKVCSSGGNSNGSRSKS